jgi:hypothetical protein
MEPFDYYDAPINKVLHFIRSVGLIKDQSKGEAHWIIEGCSAMTRLLWPTPYAFIHPHLVIVIAVPFPVIHFTMAR